MFGLTYFMQKHLGKNSLSEKYRLTNSLAVILLSSSLIRPETAAKLPKTNPVTHPLQAASQIPLVINY